MSELPILDQARLELISRGDGAIADEFVHALIDEADALFVRLRVEVAGGNRTLVTDLAHTLKGMAGEVGAQRLRAAAAALEAAEPAAWEQHARDAAAALEELRALAGGP